jgi:hypothetical protein
MHFNPSEFSIDTSSMNILIFKTPNTIANCAIYFMLRIMFQSFRLSRRSPLSRTSGDLLRRGLRLASRLGSRSSQAAIRLPGLLLLLLYLLCLLSRLRLLSLRSSLSSRLCLCRCLSPLLSRCLCLSRLPSLCLLCLLSLLRLRLLLLSSRLSFLSDPFLIKPPLTSSSTLPSTKFPSCPILPTKSPKPVPLPTSAISSSPSSASLIAFFRSAAIGILFAPVPLSPTPLSATGNPNALASASASASLILFISSFLSLTFFSSSVSPFLASELPLAYQLRSRFFCQRPTGAMREWPR